MLKHCFKVFYNTSTFSPRRGLCSSTEIAEKWDLFTSVCLERQPLITASLNEIEQNFKKLVTQVEYEQSSKSEHELKHQQELKQQESLKRGDIAVDVSVKATAQDLLDRWNDELAQFRFGCRITEADKCNDLKSLNRKLEKHLVLLVKQQLGKKNYFLLPQGLRQDGETLRHTAERVLKDTCPDIKAQFYGNAPSGFYKYKYPKDLRKEGRAVGAKMFIYSAKYCKGELPNEGLEFKWLDKGELSKELNENYYGSIAQFLVDEE